MADFLIRNNEHWMDRLTQAEVQERIAKDPSFEESYKTRYQRGDVIEIGKDGHWADTQHGGGKFLIIRVPFLPFEQAKTYMQEWKGVHRRRYRMWFENISEEEMQKKQVAPYVYQLNAIDELLLYGQDKVDEI